MWPPEGWRRREERRWDLPEEWDIQLETPNRPVVGVSWYEAQAYCRWLGEQRSQVVRLPREDEWQQAAESAVALGSSQAPTPVGIYPSGASRHGHLDMVGNVWEWCEDAFRLPKSSEGLRAIRGCGWASFSQLADASTNWAVVSGGLASRTVTTRGKILPSSRSRSVGFRVALYSLTPENPRRIMGSLGERRALVEAPEAHRRSGPA
jgi:formylglycine-generating enzyme required for sulfatase activity